jgi:aspartyl-tRNA synthetase
LKKALKVESGDVVVFTCGEFLDAANGAGRVRIQLANFLQSAGLLRISSDDFKFLWVVDFPLFSWEGEPPHLASTHHPFTAPFPEDEKLLEANDLETLLRIRGLHYDIVVNGVEVGGGSIRIHNPALQHKVFEKLNLAASQIQQFSHLLEALKFGAPPHGGIALGFDRLIAILTGASSLRDVIAFPKTSSGNELMTNSPSPIPQEALAEFGLKFEETTK